jgi:CHAT domain-containing protein
MDKFHLAALLVLHGSTVIPPRSNGTKEDYSNPFFRAAFTLTGQWN